MLYILLTFDYELFFNRTYSTNEDILIKPTQDLMDIMSVNGVKGTFFVDTCMLKKFHETGYGLEDKIITQIHEMHRHKMEVGLHTHMIWESAKLRSNSWIFQPEDYMPSAHSKDVIRENIIYGIELLNKIAAEEGSPNCISYRAGGFCFEPASFLFDELYDAGIRIDSSVCKYYFKFAYNQKFNYIKVPNKSYWFMEKEILRPQKRNCTSMLEIPITATNKLKYTRIINRLYPSIRVKPKGEGSVLLYNSKMIRYFERLITILKASLFLNADGTDYRTNLEIIKSYLKSADDMDGCVVLIGHPKFQDAATLRNLEQFITESKKRFDCKFVTLRDFYTKLI